MSTLFIRSGKKKPTEIAKQPGNYLKTSGRQDSSTMMAALGEDTRGTQLLFEVSFLGVRQIEWSGDYGHCFNN